MNDLLKMIKTKVYESLGFFTSDFEVEMDSQEYDACHFKCDSLIILSRNSKLTPKKVGQFVTFWKRHTSGVIQPFQDHDKFDILIVNARRENRLGQFVFPKSVLLKHGIVSTSLRQGKRAFRVYPVWDTADSKQAQQTQKWQLDYFYEIDKQLDLEKVSRLYKVELK